MAYWRTVDRVAEGLGKHGESHANSGLLPGPEVEAFVARHALPGLITDWFLLPSKPGTRPNVTIRAATVVPDEIPYLALAADLAERPGSREQRAAFEIVRAYKFHSYEP